MEVILTQTFFAAVGKTLWPSIITDTVHHGSVFSTFFEAHEPLYSPSQYANEDLQNITTIKLKQTLHRNSNHFMFSLRRDNVGLGQIYSRV
jgi:hypothetical protein